MILRKTSSRTMSFDAIEKRKTADTMSQKKRPRTELCFRLVARALPSS
jgi:hypothetical protein